MLNVIANQKIPIKLWVSNLEASALEQAENLANLPFAFKHIALMPDAHAGYGMPIGGVLATKNVVVPNAVGVDIGCVDSETEFLSPTGWVKISEYSNEKVMQYDPTTGLANFIEPTAYIKLPCDKFVEIKTKYGVDQKLSLDHRCLVYAYDRSNAFSKFFVESAESIYNKHVKLKNGYRHKINTTFVPIDLPGIALTDEELRVMVMCCADGHIDKKKIILRFKKERKIERCELLLLSAKIDFKKTKREDITSFSIYPPILKKGLHQFWNANLSQLKIISDEVIHWDGNQKDQCFYTSKKLEADFIQYVFSATGYRGVLIKDNRTNEKYDPGYRVFRHKNIKVGINGVPKSEIKIVHESNSFKYCFTVPSSFLVLRRGNNVFITGNCGMCAVKTSMTRISDSELKRIVGEIRKVVPVGFGGHQKIDEDYIKSLMPKSLESNDAWTYWVTEDHYWRSLYQLGTLGSGNHFIEIQKDTDGYIWAMIHSGSRNLGKVVADHYNKVAIELNSKYFSDVPKEWQLAFLPLESDEAINYLKEMQYCVEYAFANRKLMMDRVIEILLDSPYSGAEAEPMINIAHNYARMEHHFGENVLVHRKGATSARLGEIGIIPGSQGTKSYIVRGLGNKDSFESCSHGAGRKMGRKEAQRTLDLQTEIDILNKQGIVHGIRNVSDLDEAPSVYKNIDEVMENQKDLVEIVTELRPIAVVKG